MTKKRWKPVQPHSLEHATRLCTDYALHRYNRSVVQVADLVGVSEWTVYKWMGEGTIPTRRIRPFEHACGATFVTQWLAASAQKLVIDIPRGRAVDHNSLLDLQNALNEAVSQLTRFYRDEGAETPAVLQSVTHAMQELAGHRENVHKRDNPELSLFEGGAA